MALLLLRKKPVGEQMVAQRRGDHNKEEKGAGEKKKPNRGTTGRIGFPDVIVLSRLRVPGIRHADSGSEKNPFLQKSRIRNPGARSRSLDEAGERKRTGHAAG
jgi:hypothetical protein